MAGISSQGLTFSFGGTTMTVTSVAVNDTQQLVDGSHLGIAPSGRREYVGGFGTDREVTVDLITTTVLSAGTSGALAITGPITFSGNATIASTNVNAGLGEICRGSATFRVA